MVKRTGIWRFSGPLRVTALVTAAFYSLAYVITWVSAWLGDTSMAFDFVDVVVEAPLSPLQILFGMLSSGLLIGSMVFIAITANKFLKIAYREGFFEAGIARTLKHLGRALVLFYGGLFLDNFTPWVMTRNLEPALQKEANWLFLDPTLVALIAGFVLLLLSNAMSEAHEIDADNKQIV